MVCLHPRLLAFAVAFAVGLDVGFLVGFFVSSIAATLIGAVFAGPVYAAAVPSARAGHQRACRAAYWLMHGSGLRPGEVYNLTLNRVDLESRRVHVANRAATDRVPPFVVKADGQSGETKDRSVPIPEAAMADITAACQEAFKSGGFVVLTPERFATVQRYWRLCRNGELWGGRKDHRPWLNRDMMNNLLRDTKAYLHKAGVELTAPFTLTTFRKSFGQNHANAATPPRTLAKLLGHSKASVTMEFYNRVTDASEQAAARTMDRILSRPCNRAAGTS